MYGEIPVKIHGNLEAGNLQNYNPENYKNYININLYIKASENEKERY